MNKKSQKSLIFLAIISIIIYYCINILKNQILEKLTSYNLADTINLPITIKTHKDTKITSLFPAKIQLNSATIIYQNSPVLVKNIEIELNLTDLFQNNLVINNIKLSGAKLNFSTQHESYKKIIQHLSKTKIIIKNSEIKLNNHKITNFNASIPKLQQNTPQTIKASGTTKLLNTTINFNASSLIKTNNYNLYADNTNITIETPTTKKTISITSSFNGQYKVNENSLNIKDLSVNTVNINIQGELNIKNELNQIKTNGNITIHKFNLHDTLANLEYQLPFKDLAFQKISLKAAIKDNQIKADGILDATAFTIEALNNSFNITANKINVNNYTPKNNEAILKWAENKILLINTEINLIIKAITLNKNQQLNNIKSKITIANKTIAITGETANNQETINYQAKYSANNFASKTIIHSNNLSPWLSNLINHPAPIQASGNILIKTKGSCLTSCPEDDISTINLSAPAATIKINNTSPVEIKQLFSKMQLQNNTINATYQTQYKNFIIDGSGLINIESKNINAKINTYTKHSIINQKIKTKILSGTLNKMQIKSYNNLNILSNFTSKILNTKFKINFNRE